MVGMVTGFFRCYKHKIEFYNSRAQKGCQNACNLVYWNLHTSSRGRVDRYIR